MASSELDESEINQTLSSYELLSYISVFGYGLGISGGGFPILGGEGIYGLSFLASYLGFGGISDGA